MEEQNISLKTQRIIIDNQPQFLFLNDMFSHIYEERALLLANTNDIVVLRNSFPEEYIDFIKSDKQFEIITLDSNYYNEELTDAVLKEKNLQTIKNKIDSNCSKILLQSYIPDEKISLIGQKLGIRVCGKKFFCDYHKKSIINDLCSNLQLNTIQSISLKSEIEISSSKTQEFISKHKKVIIKPEVGLGGQFISKEDSLNRKETKLSNAYPMVLQEYLPVQTEGSIQFYKTSQKWNIFLCETFQKEFQFYGYKYPYCNINEDEIIIAASKFLSFFINKYMDDMPSFGIDFIVSNNKVYFHDINPRNTGVTYIFSLLHRIYGECMLKNMQCMYLQIKYNRSTTYSELRKIFESYGLKHIAKDVVEGYALLYPGMLETKTLNILLVSNSNKINEYKKLLYRIIDQSLT